MGGSNKSSSNQNSSSSGLGVNSGIGVNYGVNTSGQQSNSSGSSSQFNQSESAGNVWDAQAPSLENLYAQNTDQYNQAITGINDLQPQVQQQVQDAFGNAASGMANQSAGGFGQYLQGQVGPNAFTDGLKQNIADDAQLLKQQNLGGLDARAAAAGMSGSTGYQDMATKSMNDVDRNALQQMSQLDFNAQNQVIQNQMALANQMNQAQQFGAAGANNLQSAAMNQFNPFMSGMQATGMYGNIMGAPTVLNTSSSAGGGSSSNSSSGSSFSNGMDVGVNMNQGTNVNNSVGNGSSSGSGWNVSYPGA
jgi:hypothetical protein